MDRRRLLGAGLLGLPALAVGAVPTLGAEPVDDTDVPPVAPPPGAVLLFDGKDLSKWVNRNGGGPAGWVVQDGYAEVKPSNGDIHTRDLYVDYQLHVEFWLPLM